MTATLLSPHPKAESRTLCQHLLTGTLLPGFRSGLGRLLANSAGGAEAAAGGAAGAGVGVGAGVGAGAGAGVWIGAGAGAGAGDGIGAGVGVATAAAGAAAAAIEEMRASIFSLKQKLFSSLSRLSVACGTPSFSPFCGGEQRRSLVRIATPRS